MRLCPGAGLRQGCRNMQAYPFVVRKVLRNSSSGSRSLLRDIVFDADGNVKPARMSAILNAALGYVAEQTDGFVDFDAVPAEGAPIQVSIQPAPQCLGHHQFSCIHSYLLHTSASDMSWVSREKAVRC